MPPDLLYFAAGGAAGLIVGAGLALLVTRVTGLFRTPEEARLRREVAELRRRLERKDRAIDEMLRHAADLAGRVSAAGGAKLPRSGGNTLPGSGGNTPGAGNGKTAGTDRGKATGAGGGTQKGVQGR